MESLIEQQLKRVRQEAEERALQRSDNKHQASNSGVFTVNAARTEELARDMVSFDALRGAVRSFNYEGGLVAVFLELIFLVR